MRRAGGFVRITGPDRTDEADSFTCKHCGCVKIVKAKQRPEDIGGLCKMCMGMICADCVKLMRCDPLEKKLERAEASYHARRSYGIAS